MGLEGAMELALNAIGRMARGTIRFKVRWASGLHSLGGKVSGDLSSLLLGPSWRG